MLVDAEHVKLRDSNVNQCIKYKRLKVIYISYLLHVRSEPHGRWLIFWFVPLAVLYCHLYQNTSDLHQTFALFSLVNYLS